ncbi:unnamed protein product [Mytilus coruscus]|uniref:Uncharacterized protein n=1 Tax=Mytilus coruscus TaxID=42192 RepID=A0A6J8CFE0_MYTCO|nr:unnamed protein product [Mytilus coruscus]
MSIRMVLKSSDGLHLFEKNMAHDSTVQLDRLINLEAYWVVALTEIDITYKNSSKYIDDVYVYSNICEKSFVGSYEKPLLRKVHISKEATDAHVIQKIKHYWTNVIFNSPYYVPVRLGQVNQVHIYLKDDKGQPCSVINLEACVTLHFKKYPFL